MRGLGARRLVPAAARHLRPTYGHFYSRNVPGSRAVSVYRWQNQYFLPPRDQQWINADRRYDCTLRPTDQD